MKKSKKEYVYQLYQIWQDDGSEFLMGTYKTLGRAKEEMEAMIADPIKYPVEYIIKNERVIQ